MAFISKGGQRAEKLSGKSAYTDQNSDIEGIKGKIGMGAIEVIEGDNPIVRIVFSTGAGEIERFITPSGLLAAIQDYFRNRCVDAKTGLWGNGKPFESNTIQHQG